MIAAKGIGWTCVCALPLAGLLIWLCSPAVTAAGADETLMLTAPYAASVSGDRFAELVYAARNKAIEVEPEPVPPPPVRTSNTPLFVLLVLAFVIACILVEHTNIARFFPASARFFALLGLK